MAAFLIPIKALFVAAAADVPRYIIDVVGDASKSEVVFLLSTMAMGLYILHLIIDVVRSLLEQQAMEALLKFERVAQVEGSSLHFRKAFEFAAKVLSSVVFSIAIIQGLSFLVDGLVPALGIYFVTMIVAYSVLYERFQILPPERSKQLSFHVGVISAIGFLGGFCFILLQVLSGEIDSVILAVLGLVLLRLLMNQVSVGFKSGLALNNSFIVYSHLLSGSAFTKKHAADDDLTESFGTGVLALPEIWRASGLDLDVTAYRWMDSNMKGVTTVFVSIADDSAATVKVYARGAQSAAERERQILQHLRDSNLSTPVLAEFKYAGRTIRILRQASEVASEALIFRPARELFLSNLMAFEPSDRLLALSATVNKPIHRRIDLVHIVNILKKQILNKGETPVNSFDRLCAIWPSVQDMLDRSPVQLVVKAVPGTLEVVDDDSVVCRNWEFWSIEPVGAIWEGAAIHGSMQDIHDVAKQLRPSLKDVATEQLQLVHILCRLEAAESRQRLAMCADLVVQIDDLLKTLLPLETAA